MKLKTTWLAITVTSLLNPAFAFKFVDTDANGVKHIHAPFLHMDIKHHADGTKDVNVRAPFVHVNNPAGANNASVKAPFTKVSHPDGGTRVKAPFTKVNDPAGNNNNASVKAPFTKVSHPNGGTSVKAPFTKVNKPSGATDASVKAPFVNQK